MPFTGGARTETSCSVMWVEIEAFQNRVAISSFLPSSSTTSSSSLVAATVDEVRDNGHQFPT